MKKKILTYLLMLTFVCVGCSNTETDSTSVRTSIEETSITQTTDTTERVVNELMKLTVSTADTTSDYIINRVAKSGTAFYLEFVDFIYHVLDVKIYLTEEFVQLPLLSIP